MVQQAKIHIIRYLNKRAGRSSSMIEHDCKSSTKEGISTLKKYCGKTKRFTTKGTFVR